MKVHVKKIEKHPLLQAKATKTITPEESELRIREVNWIRLSADCVGGRELVGPVRVNVGQMILTLGPKLQATSCNLGRSSSAIISTFQDRRTTDARQTHLQYDAHVPLSRHSGKSSDPRKDHEAFRSRSFLPQRVKAHQFGTQMNRTCMKRQNHSN
jgi:hypothetical protein